MNHRKPATLEINLKYKKEQIVLINKLSFVDIVKANHNKIFSVKFIKKDGSIRDMNARLGVKKGVTGAGMAYDPSDYGLLTAFDMQKSEFRMINLNTVLEAKIGGEEYQIESEVVS